MWGTTQGPCPPLLSRASLSVLQTFHRCKRDAFSAFSRHGPQSYIHSGRLSRSFIILHIHGIFYVNLQCLSVVHEMSFSAFCLWICLCNFLLPIKWGGNDSAVLRLSLKRTCVSLFVLLCLSAHHEKDMPRLTCCSQEEDESTWDRIPQCPVKISKPLDSPQT